MFPPIGNALPPALASYIATKLETGAAVYRPVELNTAVLSTGPVVIDNGGAYQVVVYGGGLMRFEARPVLGRRVDATA